MYPIFWRNGVIVFHTRFLQTFFWSIQCLLDFLGYLRVFEGRILYVERQSCKQMHENKFTPLLDKDVFCARLNELKLTILANPVPVVRLSKSKVKVSKSAEYLSLNRISRPNGSTTKDLFWKSLWKPLRQIWFVGFNQILIYPWDSVSMRRESDVTSALNNVYFVTTGNELFVFGNFFCHSFALRSKQSQTPKIPKQSTCFENCYF